MHLEYSVVALRDKRDKWKALRGTGTILTPTQVLTCKHIFEEVKGTEPSAEAVQRNFKNFVFSFQGRDYCPVCVTPSETMDLCCLEYPPIEGAVPLKMARTTSLEKTSLFTAGFNAELSGSPQLNMIRNLKSILNQESVDGGWLQFTQVKGGAPKHFSGAPACVQSENNCLMLGIMYMGNQNSGHTRMIAVDPIANFLAQANLNVPITTFTPPPEAPAPPRPDGSTNTFRNISNINNSTNSDVDQTINFRGEIS
jgi:hypothetical protein